MCTSSYQTDQEYFVNSPVLFLLPCQTMILKFWARKVYKHWTNWQPQETLIYKWLQPCIICTSVIIVSQDFMFLCFLNLLDSSDLQMISCCLPFRFLHWVIYKAYIRRPLTDDQYANCQLYFFFFLQSCEIKRPLTDPCVIQTGE